MGPTGTLSHQNEVPSAPGSRLQAQLEHIHAHCGGRLYGFLRLAPHLGKRIGGQGVVVFAEHALSPLKHYAIKFFLSPGSFNIERAAACNSVRSLHESRFRRTSEGLTFCTGSDRHIRAQISHLIVQCGLSKRYGMQALRTAMPPVARVEGDPAVLLRPVEGLPAPLCDSPLPPFIVTEKGESLDLFAARSAPDFFTSLQVSYF